MDDLHFSDVAVLLPAFNEATAIARTIADFQRVLPGAQIVVCDNASTDGTAKVARRSGAVVMSEPRKGKGFAVSRLLSSVEAEVFILCDADRTYDAAAVPGMVALLRCDQLDMVTGVRRAVDRAAFRSGHRVGNRLFNALFAHLFDGQVTDVFSGLRVMSRRFVKSLPVHSSGFEIETELSAIAAAMHLPCAEMKVDYRARGHGSVSKLSTWRDGWRILRAFFNLFRHYHPLPFFSVVGAMTWAFGLGFGLPLIVEFMQTGLVLRQPTAVLVMGLMLLGALSFLAGLVLDGIARLRLEARHLVYLQMGRVATEALVAGYEVLPTRGRSGRRGPRGQTAQATVLRAVPAPVAVNG